MAYRVQAYSSHSEQLLEVPGVIYLAVGLCEVT